MDEREGGGRLPSGARRGLVIAIDGPVGAGKSTVARRLAEHLGWVHIDSGAMYRALGWKAVRLGVSLHDGVCVAQLAAATEIRIVTGPGGFRVLVDEEDVTGSLRTPPIDEAASVVSTYPAVRDRMVALQRSMARDGGVVMDGRDIGTVVFPDAELKFFLDAALSIRAARRLQDLRHAGATVDAQSVEDEVARRDARDCAREVAPLRPAPDAIRLDSTALDVEAVVARMLAEIAKRLERV